MNKSIFILFLALLFSSNVLADHYGGDGGNGQIKITASEIILEGNITLNANAGGSGSSVDSCSGNAADSTLSISTNILKADGDVDIYANGGRGAWSPYWTGYAGNSNVNIKAEKILSLGEGEKTWSFNGGEGNKNNGKGLSYVDLTTNTLLLENTILSTKFPASNYSILTPTNYNDNMHIGLFNSDIENSFYIRCGYETIYYGNKNGSSSADSELNWDMCPAYLDNNIKYEKEEFIFDPPNITQIFPNDTSNINYVNNFKLSVKTHNPDNLSTTYDFYDGNNNHLCSINNNAHKTSIECPIILTPNKNFVWYVNISSSKGIETKGPWYFKVGEAKIIQKPQTTISSSSGGGGGRSYKKIIENKTENKTSKTTKKIVKTQEPIQPLPSPSLPKKETKPTIRENITLEPITPSKKETSIDLHQILKVFTGISVIGLTFYLSKN